MKKVLALLLLLIGLLQYRLWYGDGNVREFQKLNDRIAELRQEGAKRRERNAALEAEVMDLKQGQEAVEERARQDLGMIKEGEVFVQVIDPKDGETPSETNNPPPSESAPAKPNKPAKKSSAPNKKPSTPMAQLGKPTPKANSTPVAKPNSAKPAAKAPVTKPAPQAAPIKKISPQDEPD